MNLDERLYAATSELVNAMKEEQHYRDEAQWCDLAITDLYHEIELSP